MSYFTNSIDILGDDAVIDGIIEKTIESYIDDVVTHVREYLFENCPNLTRVVLLATTTLEKSSFTGCTNLECVDLSFIQSFGNQAFSNCANLSALILRAESLSSLGNTNVIRSTKIASGTGYIYVPSALVDSYKSATNWSTYASQFRALEDYTVDGTTTGELDPTKI